jgi:hypothetical protein
MEMCGNGARIRGIVITKVHPQMAVHGFLKT